MQMSLDLDTHNHRLVDVRNQLRVELGGWAPPPDRIDPTSQLVKSLISSKTLDAVSWAAFMRLAARYPDWGKAAEAPPAEIEEIIHDVKHAEAKARHLTLALRLIRIKRGDFELNFLGEHSVEKAMAWLRPLAGIGVKSAACVLNFSRLNMRALVVDTHVHRVAKRLGLVGWRSDTQAAYETLMAATPDQWTAEDLFELHVLLKMHGQRTCTHAAPRCSLCPLAATCPKHGVEGAAVLAFSRKS